MSLLLQFCDLQEDTDDVWSDTLPFDSSPTGRRFEMPVTRLSRVEDSLGMLDSGESSYDKGHLQTNS
mgnify:CR=1 FL=1